MAAPIPTVAPAGSVWAGFDMRWTGWNGATFSLTGRASNVRAMVGVRGLSMPPATLWRTSGPTVHGGSVSGSRWTERTVFWPVEIWSDAGSDHWLERDRAFWETMRPDAPGMWEVITQDGSSRSMMCRYVDDGDHAYDFSPMAIGWYKYGITLLAEDPFWRSAPVSASWSTSAGVDFIDPAGSPPFHISDSRTIGSAQVTNLGDVEAWPTWTVAADPAGSGLTGVSVGLGGQLVGFSGTVPAGKSLVIRSDPADQRALLDGSDVTHLLTTFDFAPIPPGEDVDLTLAMVGSGTVTAAFVPRHLRAW